MSFDQLGIHLFNLVYIRWYGIILMTGALVAAYTAEILARRRRLDPEIVWDMFLWVVVGAVVGARVWHILTPPQSMVEIGMTTSFYLTHPFDAINLMQGGLGLPGALFGGALTMWIYVRRNKLSFLVWGDLAVPGIALGHAIGRLGNWVNNEVYGKPSDLPWAIYIPPGNRLTEFSTVDRYHPLFLYESLLNLLNFTILIVLGQKYGSRIKDGDLILVYILNYGLIRFGLEFLRLDVSKVSVININQVVAIAAASVAILLLIWQHGVGDWVRARRTAKETGTL